MTLKEITILKFKKKQKHINRSIKWGQKKVDDYFRNSSTLSLTPILDSWLENTCLSSKKNIEVKPLLSPGAILFANRYKKLNKLIHRRGFKLRKRANLTKRNGSQIREYRLY